MLGADLQEVGLGPAGVRSETDERVLQEGGAFGVGEQLVEQATATATGWTAELDENQLAGAGGLVLRVPQPGVPALAATVLEMGMGCHMRPRTAMNDG